MASIATSSVAATAIPIITGMIIPTIFTRFITAASSGPTTVRTAFAGGTGGITGTAGIIGTTGISGTIGAIGEQRGHV
jgi:hypothetical protein